MPEGTGLTLALWLGVSVREALKLKEVVKVAVRDWVRLATTVGLRETVALKVLVGASVADTVVLREAVEGVPVGVGDNVLVGVRDADARAVAVLVGDAVPVGGVRDVDRLGVAVADCVLPVGVAEGGERLRVAVALGVRMWLPLTVWEDVAAVAVEMVRIAVLLAVDERVGVGLPLRL